MAGSVVVPITQNPRVILAAPDDDVAIEQLIYLVEHFHLCGSPDNCSLCERYAVVVGVLLEPFEEPEKEKRDDT